MTNEVEDQQDDLPGILKALVRAVEGIAAFIENHWAGVLNTLLMLYVVIPLLAPLFMQMGATLPARLIYIVYTPFCHQLPERSYFLFGESLVYDLDELPGAGASENLLVRRSYVGDHEHGYKTALCQRDLAIYGSMFVMGFVFALARGKLPHLSWKLYLLFVLPMAIDGGTQLLGLRTSNWYLRTLTGLIFGIGTIWLIYPYIAQSFESAKVKAESNEAKESPS